MEERIKANAEMVVQQLRPLSGMDFGYDRESVEWLEGYIERLRQSGEFQSATARDHLASVFGSFLGECIVRCYGGVWTERAGAWSVAFDDSNIVFRFAKIAKQMENGVEDGIGSFFRTIPILFAGQVGLPPPFRKPWWRFW